MRPFGFLRPRLLRAESASKCMGCGQPFTMMRKKHNCRACGLVFCSRCSGQRYPLPYEPNKLSRICRGCFHRLIVEQQRHQSSPSLSSSSPRENGTNEDDDEEKDRPKGVLEVRAVWHHSYCLNIENGFCQQHHFIRSLSCGLYRVNAIVKEQETIPFSNLRGVFCVVPISTVFSIENSMVVRFAQRLPMPSSQAT